MKEYITFHQVTLDKENIGIKKLFGLNTNIHLGVEQFPGTFLRNPKNSNQIEIPENFSVVEREYSKFSNSDDAFETIKSCIYGEFKIDDSTFHRSNNTPPDLYFCFFDNEDDLVPRNRLIRCAIRICEIERKSRRIATR